MKSHPKHSRRAIGCALLTLLVSVSPAAAQDDASAPNTPEARRDMDEMTVLATGRDDFLKDMTVSTTTFSASEIESLRIQNIADLAGYTPNLEINTRSSASNPTLFIRGIGLKDYNANAAGAVAIYQDGININSPAIQLGQLFDTEEIAVLRGPQGSVNGRNATAGAIMINSVLPDGELDASASFTWGNYDNLQGEGALAFPLIEDLLSARMSFTANFRNGTTKNQCANWDPESIGQPRLTEQSIRDAWVFNGSPTNRRIFPRANPDRRETDSQGRPLVPDNVCIFGDAGFLSFEDPTDPTWNPNADQTVRTLSDFQGLNRHVNNVKNWAARAILRLQPDVDDGMDWVLNFHGGQNLGDSARLQSLRAEFRLGTDGAKPFYLENKLPSDVRSGLLSGKEGSRTVDGVFTRDENGVTVPGGRGGDDVNSGFYDRDGEELLDTWGVGLRGEWDTGSVVITSISGYEWYDRTIDDEGDAIATPLIPADYEDSAWQLSEELRARGEGDDYNWMVGGYVLYEELDANNLFPGIKSRRIEQDFSQELTSTAAYANGRYWLFDEVYLEAGARYNREKKQFTLASLSNALGGGSNVSVPEEQSTETWEGFTGDVTLAWEPGGDWMYDARLDTLNLYVKYGRGMKGGHFNAGLTILQPAGVIQRLEPVDPEFINSLEVGFKSSWLQNRLVMNFALFRYWYEDLQVFDFENEAGALPVQKLLSTDAKVLGAELELVARPLPGFLLQFGAGWLDSEFEDFTVSKAVGSPRGQGPLREFDYSGNPLISAPEWSLTGVAEYQIPLFHLGSIVPHYDVRYRGKVYLDPQKLDPISQDPFWIHNVRLAYRTRDGRIEVAAWVENFLDERYKIDVFDLTLDSELIVEVWNDPRLYGVSLSISF